MAQYYYTVASLPLLAFDADQFPATEVFLTLVAEAASKADAAAVASASLAPGENPLHELIAQWWRFEASLRNELVRLRASALSLDGEPYIAGNAPLYNLADLAREAFSQESPLAAETLLDRGRWAYLDELETGHYFDLEKLIVYYLRLQILERRALFTRERGLKHMQDIYDGFKQPVRV